MGGGLFGGRVGNNNNTKERNLKDKERKLAVVYDVVLDDQHELVKGQDNASKFIGSIKWRSSSESIPDPKSIPYAHPLDKNFKTLPVINEIVEIVEIGKNVYGYRRTGLDINPSITAADNLIDKNFDPKALEEASAAKYSETAETGTAESSNDTSEHKGPGKYYKTQIGIHKLKLYEGDNLIESRFGQSIRFSAYNNDKKEFSPTLILRNGESPKNRKLKEGVTIEEDINTDGSIIAMGSGVYEMAFQPGTVDDKGKSDFETKVKSFESYPTKLIGDQLLMSSGRLIFSAKNAEMMFFSKKNYGFISDGALSIDNKLGINVNVGDNINVVTNNRDVRIYSGKGSIFLGDQAPLEPLVKGQQLVNILHELITAISNQVFLTPSGPTDVGPTNVSDFQKISDKLNDILSKLNQTA
jgi:hypothetical protein